MTAPEIGKYIDWLGHINYRLIGNRTTYTEETYAVIDEIFAQMQRISPFSENGARELWLTAPRGTIEDFGNYEDWLDWEMTENYEDFKQTWLDYFPTETVWYHLQTHEDPDIHYHMVMINNQHVLEVDPRKQRVESEALDILPFVEWILESVKGCIREIEADAYNNRIEQGVPPRLRTGTIVRRDLWTVFPEWREKFLADISPEEISEFIHVASQQDDCPDYTAKGGRPTFTSGEFFKLCALGYAANHYEGTELSPVEQYKKYADGRDDGLTEIDPDSTEAFVDWLDIFGIGHPWEVCRGGNSTHVDCGVYKNDNGFFLFVAGSSEGRTVEAVKFYLAIHHAGYPVYIDDVKQLIERFQETEKIGIVPDGVFPRYCGTWFPSENVIDFMNLPYDRTEETIPYCVWQPLFHPTLLEQE